MIEFRQKCFTEYDAMRSLYTRIVRDNVWSRRIKRIDKSALIPILKGNNVVIEKFVISKSFFGKDRYRMYLKLGAKVKLPDNVRLPGRDVQRKILQGKVEFNSALFGKNKNNQQQQNNNQGQQKNYSEVLMQKEFNGGGGGPKPTISGNITPYWDITTESTIPGGETLKYDTKERSLVLEFDSIESAIRSLDVLPFGLDYNLYILE